MAEVDTLTVYRAPADPGQELGGWLDIEFDPSLTITTSALCMTHSEVARVGRDLFSDSDRPTIADDAKPLTTTERKTLLLLIAVMAADGYRIPTTPGARFDGIGELLRDCEKRGVNTTDDTLRAKLREAFDLLRQQSPAP